MNAPFKPEALEDTSEARWEALRDECEREFEAWQAGDYARREFDDFSNWIVNKASWNGGGKYLEALNYSERQRISLNRMSDTELQAVSRGQRKWSGA